MQKLRDYNEDESESEESESTPAGSKEEPEAPSKVENHVTNQSKPEEKPKDDKVAISTSIQGGGSSTHGGSAGSASTEKSIFVASRCMVCDPQYWKTFIH